ncbi:ComEC/Rec2 family competence protein [Streptomyces luteogriseus]|uniref:ComEC/Rec2 family competence protein n=1 Tax=Streptomyces luteogriseus TaxID=68233 RepID=UPI0036E94B07
MFTFEFLDAHHGDCFLVHWGAPHDRVMLVDGGPGGVYRATLRDRLRQLRGADGGGPPHLDVVCLSHVDEDHVGGLDRLFRDMRRAQQDGDEPPYSVGTLWFNAVEELVDRRAPGLSASVRPLLEDAATDTAFGASYQQGRTLRDAATALGLAGNAPFGGPLTEGAGTVLDDMDVTVVAPDEQALAELEERWLKAKQRGDPGVISAGYTDGSVPNLSSIVLLLGHAGRTALLTGDARGDRVLSGLRALGLLDDSGPLHVDLLKLPHHGSERNVEAGFFEQVRADHYVISADGVRHHHPSENTLRWLVESRAANDAYVVHLTNHIAFAEEELTRLREGRAFDIDVRAPAEPALLIMKGDPP